MVAFVLHKVSEVDPLTYSYLFCVSKCSIQQYELLEFEYVRIVGAELA